MNLEHFNQSLDTALIFAVAGHALKSKLEEFTAETITEAVLDKIPPQLKDSIPIDIMTANHQRSLDQGVRYGVFVITIEKKYKLTERGTTLAARWYFETGSMMIDVTRN